MIRGQIAKIILEKGINGFSCFNHRDHGCKFYSAKRFVTLLFALAMLNEGLGGGLPFRVLICVVECRRFIWTILLINQICTSIVITEDKVLQNQTQITFFSSHVAKLC